MQQGRTMLHLYLDACKDKAMVMGHRSNQNMATMHTMKKMRMTMTGVILLFLQSTSLLLRQTISIAETRRGLKVMAMHRLRLRSLSLPRNKWYIIVSRSCRSILPDIVFNHLSIAIINAIRSLRSNTRRQSRIRTTQTIISIGEDSTRHQPVARRTIRYSTIPMHSLHLLHHQIKTHLRQQEV